MKCIAINGSPRPEGNTAYLLNYALKQLEKEGMDVELINLSEKEILPCEGCYTCVETKKCKLQDDFSKILDKMLEADGILFGSPVYHSAVTGRLKALLNRAGFVGRWKGNEMAKDKNYEWKGTAFSGKVAAPITVARRTGQNFTFAELLLWMTVNDLIVVGSNYWSMGVAGKGGAVDANEDEEAKSIIEHMSSNMMRVIKSLKKKGEMETDELQ